MNNRAHVITSSLVACSPTCLRHALRSLHAGIENLFGGDEEDAVRRLIAIHNLQLLHQEVHAAVHVLLPHLTHTSEKKDIWTFFTWAGTDLSSTIVSITIAFVKTGAKVKKGQSNEGRLTSSMYSGSLAEASQRLLRMKMLGLDRRSLTLWKKCFSCVLTKGRVVS